MSVENNSNKLPIASLSINFEFPKESSTVIPLIEPCPEKWTIVGFSSNIALAKLEMYSKTEVVRKLEYRRLEKVQNIWTPLELEMTDAKKNSKTLLKTEKLEYNTVLKPDRFTLDALRRGE